jgi:multidrug efflux pump subunit AcrA (membrane-fusion protein)
MNRASFGAGFVLLLSGCVIGATGFWFASQMKPKEVIEETATVSEVAVSNLRQIKLTGEKLKAANLTVTTVQPRNVRETFEVPSNVGLNTDRRVEVQPRIAGIVRQVDVLLGQKVKAGQRLALLESPDVGSARLNVRSKLFDLQIARREAEWRSLIAENAKQVIDDLASRPEVKTLETKYSNVPLGHDRAMLLASYAKLELARHEEDKQKDLYSKSLVGEHIYHQALHTREAAQAEFESALEQTKFDVVQEKRLADQKVQQSEVDLITAIQRLRLLGVPDDDPYVRVDLSSSVQLSTDWTKSVTMEDIAAYPIFAPFDGTITSRSVVPSQRVDVGSRLFDLADLDLVRINAQVAEKDFSTLADLKVGDVIDVIAPGSQGRVIHGKIIYVGTEVDPQTRTVPVVAECDNRDGRLRPGQFCRVRLQREESQGVLAAPGAAFVEWNGKPGVFLAGDDGETFEFQPVLIDQLPSDDEHLVIIRAGMKAGQKIVTSGAFMLKSELVLESEPEEE